MGRQLVKLLTARTRFFILLWHCLPGGFLKKSLVRSSYDSVHQYLFAENPSSVRLLNYGYASLDESSQSSWPIKIDPEDLQEYSYSWRLVYEITRNVDFSKKNVLVVGCGRGGDAYFIKKYLGAEAVTGIDISELGIQFCLKNYSTPGLFFQKADAEKLPFRDQSLDVVVNIESSHNYPNILRFYKETYRVLKSGGSFLYADFFWNNRPQRRIKQAGFDILEEEDITRNVMMALSRGRREREEIFQRSVPKVFLKDTLEWSGISGTFMNDLFKKGYLRYKRFKSMRPICPL